MKNLKIATFNVNGIGTRERHLLEWLRKETPDIVCLQELKAIDQKFPAKALADAGYGSIWHGQQSWNGVAILARGQKPVETRRGLPGDPGDTHSRYIEAAVHGIVVGCLYLPNGNPQPGPKFDYKLKWMDRLLAYAKPLFACGLPVVLAGDYNVVPTDELDIYNPRSWKKDALLQPAPRARYRELLAQGWTDAIRHLHPDEKIFTFWDYFRQHWEKDSGLRIDHLLLNATLAPGLRACGVDRWVRGLEKASDHAPTWIEVETDDTAVNSSGPSRPRANNAPPPAAPRRSRRKGT
jgi:exodeoxyribonuclease-3